MLQNFWLIHFYSDISVATPIVPTILFLSSMIGAYVIIVGKLLPSLLAMNSPDHCSPFRSYFIMTVTCSFAESEEITSLMCRHRTSTAFQP
ncbi:MAG: hypothetical protein N3E52_05955 [Candidatus Bathyarchaeota archaeon]|nr:hypothetical protein [Candidatus Bathyarchaeota archaeon]